MKELMVELRQDAMLMIRRFITDQPANFIEKALFDVIREVGQKIGDWLQSLLDQLRGVTTKPA